VQTGQVSIIVPIVVAAFGVAGIVLGQLINARRADRRWNRERDREELRWERERLRLETANRHDRQMGLTSHRMETYAVYLSQLAVMTKLIDEGFGIVQPREPSGMSIDEAQKQVLASLSMIDIIGATSTRDIAHSLDALLLTAILAILKGRPSHKDKDWFINEIEPEIRKGRNDFLRAIRAELGVDSQSDQKSIND
jgi:hypothetical protein